MKYIDIFRAKKYTITHNYPFKYPNFKMIIIALKFKKKHHLEYLFQLENKTNNDIVRIMLPEDLNNLKVRINHEIDYLKNFGNLNDCNAIRYFFNLSSKLFLEKMRKKGVIYV